jgi:y4mF family transcriptional regulator
MKDDKLYPKGIGLSEFVKAKRREQDWTQVQLADYAGVGLRFIRELEQGKASLRLDKVNQVLDLFSACMGPVPIDRSIYADG